MKIHICLPMLLLVAVILWDNKIHAMCPDLCPGCMNYLPGEEWFPPPPPDKCMTVTCFKETPTFTSTSGAACDPRPGCILDTSYPFPDCCGMNIC